MRRYFYSAASLPMLVFDEAPFYSSDEVMELFRSEVTNADIGVLEQAAAYFGSDGRTELHQRALRVFDRYERGVRSVLARLRAQKLGWEFDLEESVDAPVDQGTEIEKVARDAMSNSSPYEAEMVLQRGRWERLSEIGTGRFFDLDSLVVYVLKLRVVERNLQMETDAGAERFNEIYSGMAQQLRTEDGVMHG